MRTLTSTRLHFLAGAGGLLAASACSGAPGTSGLAGGRGARPASSPVLRPGATNRRTGVAFPQARPDGSKPPATDAHYHPKTVRGTPQRTRASVTSGCGITVVCGDGGGTSPDTAAYSSAISAYGWNSQSYSEKWDAGTLVKQNYFSVTASGLAYSVYYCDGIAGSVTFPIALPSGATWFSSSDGQVAALADPTNATFAVVHASGDQASGYIDSYGYSVVTLAFRSAGGPVQRQLAIPIAMTINRCNWFQRAQMAAMVISVYLWGAEMHLDCDYLNVASVDLCNAYNAMIEAEVEAEVEAVRSSYAATCYG